MAISPKCDRCGKELDQPGGLLFSPPDDNGMARKYHLCKACFALIEKDLSD